MKEITLRHLNKSDAAEIAEICNDEKLQKFILLSRIPYTICDALNFIEFAQNCYNDGGEQIFAICADGRLVGIISYTLRNGAYSNSASIGYYVGSKFQNNGYCTQAVKCICDIIFENNQINRICAEVFSENQPSLRVLEKCGFVLEGKMRNGVIKDKFFYDVFLLALVK